LIKANLKVYIAFGKRSICPSLRFFLSLDSFIWCSSVHTLSECKNIIYWNCCRIYPMYHLLFYYNDLYYSAQVDRHHSKPNVYPLEVLPVYPDYEVCSVSKTRQNMFVINSVHCDNNQLNAWFNFKYFCILFF
jgi:hypothetical protein